MRGEIIIIRAPNFAEKRNYSCILLKNFVHFSQEMRCTMKLFLIVNLKPAAFTTDLKRNKNNLLVNKDIDIWS